jgi:macrodomain Ter protein organizer (MatP/YcbG family)
MAVLNNSSNMLANCMSNVHEWIQGGYTSHLIGLDQNATAARKLYFNEERNDTTYEK